MLIPTTNTMPEGSPGSREIVPCDKLVITVKFPRGNFISDVKDLPDHLHARFPSKTSEPQACLLDVCLSETADVKVEGFGMPFSHPGHISEDLLINLRPIVGQQSLVDIINHKRFTFIVCATKEIMEKEWNEALLPQPFKYPYGETRNWAEAADHNMIRNKQRPSVCSSMDISGRQRTYDCARTGHDPGYPLGGRPPSTDSQ